MFLQNSNGENLPLFCRPRKSPKLSPDSRYASQLEGLGTGSRRHSNVPYPIADDASSQCEISTPVSRTVYARKLERSLLSLTENVSKTTLDKIPVQEEEEVHRCLNMKSIDDLFINTGPKFRKNATRALSTIASSSSSDYPSETILRESRSLDLLPTNMYSKRFESPNFWKEHEGTRMNLRADISEKMLKNNYPNGNVIMMSHTDRLPNEAEPLLDDDTNKREIREKRSRSLDQVVFESSTDSVPDKKSSARKLLEIPPVSTIIQMFNGNGLRNSNVSLRRGILAGYDKQTERESVV